MTQPESVALRSGRAPLRVLLVDDVADLRLLLASLFAGHPGVQVVGEAANGEEAVELARQYEPDLVVLDLTMPVLDGVSALPLLRQVSPRSRIVVLSAVPRERDPGALALGAAAYVEKTVETDRLLPHGLPGAGRLGGAPPAPTPRGDVGVPAR